MRTVFAEERSPEQMPRLSDRLAAVRRGRFVGRESELGLFRSALLAEVPPFAVLYLYGPGGVGKTTLLREYERIAGESGRPVVRLDGRNLQPSPEGFLRGLREALGSDAPEPDPQTLPPRAVLCIDTYEVLAGLDSWLRETFLPGLAAGNLVVIAGRNRPSTAWRTELDWAELTHVVSLGNLSPDESRTYLAARDIPQKQHAEALAVTGGHPLALALVADAFQRGDRPAMFAPDSEPDMVRALLERFLQDVPTEQHRQALDVCVLARTTTEGLLASVLETPDAHDLFNWLRWLSFIEQGPNGLFPHDLARDALLADLRWRNPERCRKLGRAIHVYVQDQVVLAKGPEQERLKMDALFAIRTVAANRQYFDWNAIEGVHAEAAAAGDTGWIVEAARAHEGEESARIAEYWARRHLDAFRVFRADDGGEPFGFMALLPLHQLTPEEVGADPAVGAALRFIERHGPLAPGDEAVHLRYWMHRERYQEVTAAINLTAMTVVAHCISRPRLAWNFVTMADPEFWTPHFDAVNFPRAEEADFGAGGQRYGVFAHDWKAEGAREWLTRRGAPMPFTIPGYEPVQPLDLSDVDFTSAVRQSLRDFTRPDRLLENPLMRTRLVIGLDDPSPAALQAVLREALATLAGNPRDIKFHRALWHTYIEPAPTQELVAELLDLPFNTYRYHLSHGLQRLTAILRQRERGGF